jgi:hypothetical protein
MTTTPKVPLGQVILKKTYLINFFKHNMEQAEVSTTAYVSHDGK